MKLWRLEVFDDHPYRGGSRIDVLRERVQFTTEDALNEESTWSISVPGVPDSIVEHHVIRAVFDNGSYVDRRILRHATDYRPGGEITTEIGARSMLYDLGLRTIIGTSTAAGVPNFDLQPHGLTAAEHIDGYILGAQIAAGEPYWHRGTVQDTVPRDMTYAWDTPLAALRRLAQMCGLEIVLRDDGAGNFYLDLVVDTGSGSTPIVARPRRNLGSVTRDLNAQDQATFIIPRGAPDSEGFAPGLDTNRWRLVSWTWVTPQVTAKAVLSDLGYIGFGPCRYAGQLVGKWLRIRDMIPPISLASFPITADDPVTQQVTLNMAGGGVPSPAGWTPVLNQAVEIRENAPGHPAGGHMGMIGLSKPGVTPRLVALLDMPDQTGAHNLIWNPFLRVLGGPRGPTFPTFWEVIIGQSPTNILPITDPVYWETAGHSLRIMTTAENQGMQTPAPGTSGYNTPTPLNDVSYRSPMFSWKARLYVTAGQFWVYVTLYYSDGAGGWTAFNVSRKEFNSIAYTSETEAWVTVGVEGLDIGNALEIWNAANPTSTRLNKFTHFSLAIRQYGTVASTCYIDRAQLTQSPRQEPWVEGSGGALMWRTANERLDYYEAAAETLNIDVRDLSALDGGPIPFEAPALGGRIMIRVEETGLASEARIVRVRRDWNHRLLTGIDLGNPSEELTRTLTRATPPKRLLD